jgi:hypothetical protein
MVKLRANLSLRGWQMAERFTSVTQQQKLALLGLKKGELISAAKKDF